MRITLSALDPANSFGFMDGGLDLVYSQFFLLEQEPP